MLESYLMRGIFIGLLFGVPAGAIGALTIQRSLAYGFIAGFVTGIGSSVADLMYAFVGVFGITIVSDFLTTNETIISIVGGGLIVALGVSIYKKESIIAEMPADITKLWQFFISSFAIAVANPATIMTFLIAFSSFGIVGRLTLTNGTELILGILIGTACWWGFLSGIVTAFKSRITSRIYKRLNQLLGTVMFLFGIVMIIKVFL